VGKGHSKPVSVVGERHNEVARIVASGGTGEGHIRQCMCSCKGHRELDSTRERICTFTSSRLKEPKKDLLLNEVARNVEVQSSTFNHSTVLSQVELCFICPQ